MKKTKLIITTLIIMLAIILLNTMEVNATLQANPNTHYNSKNRKSDVAWMSGFRQMEEKDGGMGLSETLNEDLTASSKSNGIDVHMMRSTEYGAIAILSASGYGNNQTLQKSTIKTTTGNKTGVYFSGANSEVFAGGIEGKAFPGTNKKYYDTYTTERSSAKVGDALGERTNNGCQGWHSASSSGWINSNGSYCFKRGEGGLFSFDYYWYGDGYYGRGVAVCGKDL